MIFCHFTDPGETGPHIAVSHTTAVASLLPNMNPANALLPGKMPQKLCVQCVSVLKLLTQRVTRLPGRVHNGTVFATRSVPRYGNYAEAWVVLVPSE